MSKIIRGLIKSIFGLLLTLFISIAALLYFEVTIDLTRVKTQLGPLLSKVLDRPVEIEKSISITTSLSPLFRIEGLNIKNPETFNENPFIQLESAQIKVALLSLFQKKIHIKNIAVKTLKVQLERKGEQVNWLFAQQTDKQEEPAPPPTTSKGKRKSIQLVDDSIVIDQILLKNISVSYKNDEPNSEQSEYSIQTCKGGMGAGEKFNLELLGKLQKSDYKAKIEVASLKEFIETNSSWMKFDFSIEQTDLSFEGNVNLEKAHQQLRLKTKIAGSNLRNLKELLEFDIPPFADYLVEIDLQMEKGKASLHNLIIKTGDTVFNGEGKIERQNNNVFSTFALTSPLIQIDDLLFDDWKWIPEQKEEAPSKEDEKEEDSGEQTAQKPNQYKHLFDPEFLKNFDLSLNIEAKKILSGEDKIGNGNLQVLMKDGRVSIDPLAIKTPGGEVFIKASVKPGKEKSEASLITKVSQLDIGIIARHENPATDMGGMVNLDIDLSSKASSWNEILAHANGYLDFSGQLENIQSGIIDIWAISLVSAILTSTENNTSEINCTLGKWNVKDGLLTPEPFLIDTSKIRIQATGNVDFKKNIVDLTIKPKAKRPEFFSLAAPVRLKGSFPDLKIALKKGGLIFHIASFLTSPVHVPVQRVLGHDLPEDGSDVCNTPLGRRNVEEQPSH